MKLINLVKLAAVLAVGSAFAQAVPITGSKHDFSSTGLSTSFGATGNNEICVYCHTPHNTLEGESILWNRDDPVGPYTVYSSWALNADVSAGPGGGSLSCLSCHDGSIGVNSVYNDAATGTWDGSKAILPANDGYVGANLSNDHPIGFDYTDALAAEDGELVLPGAYGSNLTGGVHLLGQALECGSCHDVHSNEFPPFLAMANDNSAMCLACHLK